VTWLAIVLTGAGSYLFRLLPLVVLPRLTLRPGLERAARHAGVAAIAALLVSSLQTDSGAGNAGPTLVAVAVALALAVRGAAMLRVVSLGGLTYVMVLVISNAVS
jgi:branched-subunit amino acid transport protein